MDRANTVALVALSLSLLLSPLPSFGEAPEPAAPTPANSAAAGKPQRLPRRPDFSAGFANWSEDARLKRIDGREFDVKTSTTALVLGGSRTWGGNKKWGWIAQGDLLLGQNSTQSRDASLTYYHKGEASYGLSASAGAFYNFGPRLWIGALANPILRYTRFDNPQDYSFAKEELKLLHSVKFEFAFPLSKGLQLAQQFGIGLADMGNYWMIGLRL